MTPQERDLILGVAQRLRNANLTQKDRDAEQLILAEIGSQKDALYVLTQVVIVQEEGLRHAQETIQQLQSTPQGHGGFLSSLFGGGSGAAPPPPPAAAPPAGGGSGIGTFLGTAAAAAAGAVGGQLIYDGMHRFFGEHSMPGPQAGGFLGGNPVSPPGSGRDVADFRNEPRDTAYSGGGGDFGGGAAAGESGGGDFGGDQAASGGDFGGGDQADDTAGEEFQDDDAQDGGGDFGDSSDDDAQGGGSDF
jgi:hypothetical protein